MICNSLSAILGEVHKRVHPTLLTNDIINITKASAETGTRVPCIDQYRGTFVHELLTKVKQATLTIVYLRVQDKRIFGHFTPTPIYGSSVHTGR